MAPCFQFRDRGSCSRPNCVYSHVVVPAQESSSPPVDVKALQAECVKLGRLLIAEKQRSALLLSRLKVAEARAPVGTALPHPTLSSDITINFLFEAFPRTIFASSRRPGPGV